MSLYGTDTSQNSRDGKCPCMVLRRPKSFVSCDYWLLEIQLCTSLHIVYTCVENAINIAGLILDINLARMKQIATTQQNEANIMASYLHVDGIDGFGFILVEGYICRDYDT